MDGLGELPTASVDIRTAQRAARRTSTTTGVTGDNLGDVRRKIGSLNLAAGSASRRDADVIAQVRMMLDCEIATTKEECRQEMMDEVGTLSKKLGDFQIIAGRDATDAEITRRVLGANVESLVAACRTDLQQEINDVACAVHTLAGKCKRDQVDRELARGKDQQRLQRLEGRLDETRAELSAAATVRWMTLAAMMDEEHRLLGEAIQNLEHKLTFHFDEVRVSASEGLSCAAALQRQHDGLSSQISRAEEDFSIRIATLEASLQQHMHQAKEDGSTLLSTTESRVAHLRAETERRLSDLDQRATLLQCGVDEAGNFATRRVEWLIRDFMPLHLTATPHRWRWLSPEFAAAGVQNLQLELCLPEDTDFDDEEGLAEAECALSLRTPHRFYLVCKLYVGSASFEFKHTFDGQAPHCIERLCVLKDQVCPEDGSLLIGMEILEAVREIERPQQPPPGGGASGGCAVAGSIVAHRYLNHRMLDLVQSQVELMHSRLVRRIEWNVENASMLQRCFPEGECICSKPFEAAGVGGLQLVFYPCGSAGARPGYCSYYLQCPANSALRCWLSAGKQRRAAHMSFERPGVMGRINFCHFENCVDTAANSVLLVLEIEEAQQSVTEAMSHQPPVETKYPESPSSAMFRSNVKVQRALGGSALEDVRQLPSIWTPRPEVDVGETLEGFHTFSALRPIKKPATPRQPEKLAPYTSQRFHSNPSSSPDKGGGSRNNSKYMMYAA